MTTAMSTNVTTTASGNDKNESRLSSGSVLSLSNLSDLANAPNISGEAAKASETLHDVSQAAIDQFGLGMDGSPPQAQLVPPGDEDGLGGGQGDITKRKRDSDSDNTL